MIEDFLHLQNLAFGNWHLHLANLSLRISPRIFEKIRNGPHGILMGLGETD